MTVNWAKLRQDLIAEEGIRLEPYRCTAGKLTIGVGHNLDDIGITIEVANSLLQSDIEAIASDFNHNIPWWLELPETAQRALLNMGFQLGWPRLNGFKNMLNALEQHDFGSAAAHALDSKWARQVPDRAARVTNLMKGDEE